MIEEFIAPVSEDKVNEYQGYPPLQLGPSVTFYRDENDDIEGYHIAILGVKEGRGSTANQGCEHAPDTVRDQLYCLMKHDSDLKIIDLGNIEMGSALSDTYFALSSVVYQLLRNKVLPIIIGGSHDLTFAQYQGYQNFDKKVTMTVVDETIDLENMDDETTDRNHLMKVLTYEPNYLFNFSHIGYQSYFTPPNAIDTLDKMGFECVRLGAIRNDMEEVEPIVRDADLLSFDMGAIRQSDAPGKRDATPNGFYAEEACQIARYAGLSDKLSSIGFYDLNPTMDNRNQTSQLLAQMVWYFVDGFYNRKNDYPFTNEKDYFKFMIELNDGEYSLTFWKSKKSDRWWMQMPGEGKKSERSMVPCSYSDYQQACNDELPDKWLRQVEKMH